MREHIAHPRPPGRSENPIYHDRIILMSTAGYSPREMADSIGCDIRTVKSHLAKLPVVEIRRSVRAKSRLYIDGVINGKWQALKYFLNKYVLKPERKWRSHLAKPDYPGNGQNNRGERGRFIKVAHSAPKRP